MTWGRLLGNDLFWLFRTLYMGVDKSCLPRRGVSRPVPFVVRVAMAALTTVRAIDTPRPQGRTGFVRDGRKWCSDRNRVGTTAESAPQARAVVPRRARRST